MTFGQVWAFPLSVAGLMVLIAFSLRWWWARHPEKDATTKPKF